MPLYGEIAQTYVSVRMVRNFYRYGPSWPKKCGVGEACGGCGQVV